MKRSARVSRILAAIFLVAIVLPVAAFVSSAAADRDRDTKFKARLNGYNEVNAGIGGGIGSVSTQGRGKLELTIDDATQTMTFELTYTLEGSVTVAHVHFAQRHVGGGVVFFFCGGGGKPACPAGTIPNEATVTGTVTAADIVSSGAATQQGIAAGDFEETVRAIRAGATYANVHSVAAVAGEPSWPAGEIRGQVERD